MVEAQIICKILNTKSLLGLFQNGVTPDYFKVHRAEYEFILRHYDKFQTIPDLHTFVDHFEDFDLFLVEESDQYLIETLQEQHTFSELAPFVQKIVSISETNSIEAVNYVRAEIDRIASITSGYKSGRDLVGRSMVRWGEYSNRMAMNGLMGISTGFEELDKLTHGWLNEDFICIAGRTNEGKSWVLMKFLVAAHEASKRVLLFSGEMSESVVGFRFDTLTGHFSNLALMAGGQNLGTPEYTVMPDDYRKHLVNKRGAPFVLVTPKDIGNRRLTVPILHQLIELYTPDIVGIDQLSLMEDSKNGGQRRQELTNLAADLYLTSEKYQIPILTPVQARRAEKKKRGEDDSQNASHATPQLDEIYESDGIAQNATRVLTMKTFGSSLKLSLRKNRYGLNNREIIMMWDIDTGHFNPFLATTTKDKTTDVVSATRISQRGVDLF